MKSKRVIWALSVYSIISFWLFTLAYNSVQAQGLSQRVEGIEWEGDDPASVSGLTLNLQDDSADVEVGHTIAYPGSKNFLVTVKLKNPVSIAGFDFEIIVTQPDLTDFSTVRIYVDSMDTCSAPEDTCWKFFPIRECLVVPGSLIEGWAFFEAHGAPGDTTQPDCDQLWILGIDIWNPIPPQTNYITLFEFGVDVSCVPDSLTDRTVTFFMTGHLSDQFGQLVPFKYHPGDLTIWWSVPGDANGDSLVDLGDVLFIVNYLYKGGPDPCVIEAADPNADCKVDLGDVLYLINFLYREGPSPEPGCAH
ncbi:MAG: hypothetical protein AMJ91_05480 [candidate division Zixibacteria bacterium SM23_73_3]|nr:MAG: hypothetical protein AMJ91_05480 [candidate division Zixibacteria bacterium SM23_73_3]